LEWLRLKTNFMYQQPEQDVLAIPNKLKRTISLSDDGELLTDNLVEVPTHSQAIHRSS